MNSGQGIIEKDVSWRGARRQGKKTGGKIQMEKERAKGDDAPHFQLTYSSSVVVTTLR